MEVIKKIIYGNKNDKDWGKKYVVIEMKKMVILLLILMSIFLSGAIAQDKSEPDPIEISTQGPSENWAYTKNGDDATDSPEIFFYDESPETFYQVNEPVTTDVTVRIPNGVTLTTPEVPLGVEVTWENVCVGDDGTVIFNGEKYPYLYYEGLFSYPESNYGWLVQQVDGMLFLDGKLVNQEILIAFLEDKFLESGLYENEAKVIISRILDHDMLAFSKPYLVIRYIPMADVDKTMQLETSHPFSVMRRHFWIEERDEQIELQEPLFEIIDNSFYVIHETAINKKDQ